MYLSTNENKNSIVITLYAFVCIVNFKIMYILIALGI